MASTMETPPQALRDKLGDVKSLLKNANNRLLEEASKYEIFTTKASGDDNSRGSDIRRTITDINTLESVLSCPIFDRIVNVTDSLDQLSYHLNLHPSITEFDIDANSGELILTPPMDFAALNNNNNNHHLEMSLNFAQSTTALVNDLSPTMHQTGSADAYYRGPSTGVVSPIGANNIEKLIANGNGVNGTSRVNAAKSVMVEPVYLQPNSKDQTTNKPSFDVNGSQGARRLYKLNGHFTSAENGVDVIGDQFQSTQSINQQVSGQNHEQRRASYSNELYKTCNGLNQPPQDAAINHHFNNQQQKHHHQHHQPHSQQQQQKNQQQRVTQQSSEQTHNAPRDVCPPNQITNGRYNRGSCSPSSAGSTVRLADECDSGASSYQSQQNHNSEQDPMNCMSPELERIEVTLERDEMGLGIVVGGYTIKDEDISGIFVRKITPGSAADRCGSIKKFDQIFSVNGSELDGYSNDEALSLLRQSGKVVTLELARHLDEQKHNKLRAILARAQCPDKIRYSENSKSVSEENTSITSPAKSSIPISRGRDSANKSPTKPPLAPKPTTALVQVSTYQESSMRKAQEAASSKISREVTSPLSPSHIPVAAQRGGTNKVIETKQGLRNTIDIKSPVCQTATATYVNKVEDLDATKNNSMTDRLRREASDEFGRLVPSEEPEWDKDAKIIELHKDKLSQGLGFAVKEYANPRNPTQPIIMITSITPGGIADRDGRLSVGDLLIFVDDKDLTGQALSEAVKALKMTDGEARLGVLKLKRN